MRCSHTDRLSARSFKVTKPPLKQTRFETIKRRTWSKSIITEMTERRPDTTKSTSILAIVFFQEEKNLKKSEEILEIYRAYTA